MSFFKKKDEDRKEAYKPSNDNASAKEGSSGGKGGGEPAKPSVDPSTKAGKSAIKKSMDDGRLGYGYIDANTGVEVPWYIDMINGGGANAAGSEFVSPFAEVPLAGGMLSLPSNLSNAANIAPYGYNQPRRYAQAGMQGYPTAPAAPTPRPNGGGLGGGTGVGAGSVAEKLLGIPNSMTDDDMGLPAGPLPSPDPYAPIGGSNPAVQAEIARRQEAQRMMSYEPLGEGLYGTVEDVHFGPRAKRAQPTSLLDTRQQVPQPDEARALQAIADNNMMPDFINLPPYQQRAMITAMLERGY